MEGTGLSQDGDCHTTVGKDGAVTGWALSHYCGKGWGLSQDGDCHTTVGKGCHTGLGRDRAVTLVWERIGAVILVWEGIVAVIRLCVYGIINVRLALRLPHWCGKV